MVDEGSFTLHAILPLRGGAAKGVLRLRGGGPANASTLHTKARNDLASFLLTQGVDLNEVAGFAEKLIKAVGPQAVITIMEPKQVAKRWDGLVKLTKSFNLTLPDASNKQIQKTERLKQAIRKHVQKDSQIINLDGVTFQVGFFLNADGSNANQVLEVKPKSTGVILLTQQQADPWLSQPGHITHDEFAVCVVGECKGAKHSACTPLQMPGFDANGRPLILAICMHNIGKKAVITKHSTSSQIPVLESAVLCFTVFKDECTPDEWTNLLEHPVKHVLRAIDAQSDQMPLLAPPWGRVFQKQNRKVDPSEAESFQFHARVGKNLVPAFLRLSGTHATYISVKTEDRTISKEFQVVWLPWNDMQLQVSATSMNKCLGVVRTTRKDGRTSKGLRFSRDDYREAFAELRLDDDLPPDVKPNFLFKIYPTPLGTTHESVQKFLNSQGWGARPLRSLSSTAWLCACDKHFDAVFASWNNHSILIKWIEQGQSSRQLVIAGQLPKVALADKSNPSGDTLQDNDPWAPYKAKQAQVTQSAQLPPTVLRQLDAPIEDRFKKNEAAMTDMQTQIKCLQETVKCQGATMDAGHKQIQHDFTQLRNDCKTQFDSMTAAFQSTLESALKSQQGNMTKQFQDLKQMINRTGKRRSPTAKPDADGDKEMEEEDS
eukprot:Skav215784  [mRNA]  locus=scaffold2935:20433:22409:+ [translate_table: standard]